MERKIAYSLDIITQALKKYKRPAIFCSFGKDSMVTLHLCLQVDPLIKVISVMTPYKPVETLEYKKQIEKDWHFRLFVYQMKEVLDHGKPLYETNPEKCCDYYKVNPCKTAIKEHGIDCWICGLRGTEGHTRKFLDEKEEKNGLVKINPILSWTEAEVWLYHALEKIPVHPLYRKGYRSLGCLPCSNPYSETERGGRWEGTTKCGGECGIHTKPLIDPNYVDIYGIPKRNGGKY